MGKKKGFFGWGYYGVGFFGPTDYDNFTPTFLKYLKKPSSEWVYVIEIEWPMGVHYYSVADCSFLGKINEFINPTIIGNPSLGNTGQLQINEGVTTSGKFTITLDIDDELRRILAQITPKSVECELKIGPRGNDVNYSDFFNIKEGTLTNIKMKSNKTAILEFTDNFYFTKDKYPTQKTIDNTGYVDVIIYQNENPIDIMKNLMLKAMDSTKIDEATLATEKTNNFGNWYFHRILTKPQTVKKYLDELSKECLGNVFQVWNKLRFEKIEPPGSTETLKAFTDSQLLSFDEDLSWPRDWANRIILRYDWDEQGENPENYESVYTAEDIDSISDNGLRVKEIKSHWLKTYKYTQPHLGYVPGQLRGGSDCTGVTVYALSWHNLSGNPGGKSANDGRGYIKWNGENKSRRSLQYMAPGDNDWGPPVNIGRKSGLYLLKSKTEGKWIRVIVNIGILRHGSREDITRTKGVGYDFDSTSSFFITKISNNTATEIADVLTDDLLTYFGEPKATVDFQTDIADGLEHQGKTLHIGQNIELTTDKGLYYGHHKLEDDSFMLTKVSHDFKSKKGKFEAIQSNFVVGNDAYIAPDPYNAWILYKPVTCFRTEPYPATDSTFCNFENWSDGTVLLRAHTTIHTGGFKHTFLPQGKSDCTVIENLRVGPIDYGDITDHTYAYIADDDNKLPGNVNAYLITKDGLADLP